MQLDIWHIHGVLECFFVHFAKYRSFHKFYVSQMKVAKYSMLFPLARISFLLVNKNFATPKQFLDNSFVALL